MTASGVLFFGPVVTAILDRVPEKPTVPGSFPECLPPNPVFRGPSPIQRWGRITGSVGSPASGSATPRWNDRDFALRMVRVNSRGLLHVAPELQTDPEIAGTAVLDDFLLIEKLPEDSRAAVWSAALDWLEQSGTPFPRESIATYEDFRRFLRSHGITFENRFRSVRTVLEVAANGESLADRGMERPIALVIATTSDYNHAFEAFPLVDTLVADGRFDVLYREASTDDEARAILEETTSVSGRRVHTLILAGHGSPDSLTLGGVPAPACYFPPWPDQSRVEIGDFEGGGLGDFSEFIADDGQVLLWACSNGEGGQGGDNLANAIADQAPGRSVISVGAPSNIRALDVRSDLSLDVTWMQDDREYIAQSTTE